MLCGVCVCVCARVCASLRVCVLAARGGGGVRGALTAEALYENEEEMDLEVELF